MNTKVLNLAVIVAALGYFVDIYDLILFGMVRVPSLMALGVPENQTATVTYLGLSIISWQMIGMLLGGIVWGILGDKKGRLKVLFGSILMYSIANIINAYVTNIPEYAIIRLIAGFGLAGELGVGITLVSETLHSEKRGYGAAIVTGFGLLGALLAGVIAMNFDWHMCYIIGGVLGLLLLVLRIKAFESGMYDSATKSQVKLGNFLSLFQKKDMFIKYILCIFLAIPIWFSIGILVFHTKELVAFFHITEKVSNQEAIMTYYGGASIGGFLSGWLSQYFKSRKKALFLFILGTALMCIPFFLLEGASKFQLLTTIFLFGFPGGYWAVFMTVASEQFGTNIRATATTTIPNFVRATLVIMELAFIPLTASLGLLNGSMLIGLISFILAFIALYFIKESYGKELHYFEEC